MTTYTIGGPPNAVPDLNTGIATANGNPGADVINDTVPVTRTMSGQTIAAGETLQINALVSLQGTNTVNANLTLAGAGNTVGPGGATLDIAAGVTTTVSGFTNNVGAATLTKTGAGALQIDTNTFSVDVIVNAGTLSGTGSVQKATVNNAGLGAGDAGVGTLRVNELILNAGATFNVEIAGAASSDRVLTSEIPVLGGTLVVSMLGGFTVTAGQTYVILENTTANLAAPTTFTGLVEGSTFNVNGNSFRINYAAGTGSNDVVLTALGYTAPGGTPSGLGGGTQHGATFVVPWQVTATGGAGDDTLQGGDLNDVLDGGLGNDSITGQGADDSILGGGGADMLYGNAGADTLRGGDGNDIERGGQDNDLLFGDAGDDTLFGDFGADTLTGGVGNDVLTGGAGADLFVFAKGAGDDRITDFNLAQGDHIQVLDSLTWKTDQVGADVVVTLSDGGHITLAGVSLASLPADGWIGVG